MPKILEVLLNTQETLKAPEGGWDGILIGDAAIQRCPHYQPGKEHKKTQHGIPDEDRAKQPACVLKDGVWICTSVG